MQNHLYTPNKISVNNETGCLSWNRASNTIHIGLDGGKIVFYKLNPDSNFTQYEQYIEFKPHKDRVTGIMYDESTGYIYSVSMDKKFYITENSDGSYIIRTKVTNNESAVEIANAGKGSGDNVQQWTLNDYSNQNWIFEQVSMSVKLKGKNSKSSKKKSEIIKTEIYKNDELIHTVVFVK